MVTDYYNGFEYTNQVLASIQTEEGRIVWDAGLNSFRDEYFIKDHLGNNRVIISDLNDDGILQTSSEVLAIYNYDIWGLELEIPNTVNVSNNQYGFSNKEKQTELGVLDFGARLYDPFIGRWWGVDGMAENRNWLSTFNYCQNNPILKNDVDGKLDDNFYFNAETGQFLGVARTSGQTDNFYAVSLKASPACVMNAGLYNVIITSGNKTYSGRIFIEK
jgi:RHS repeat-associated protein